MHIPNFTKTSFQVLGKGGKWVYCKHLNYVFKFLFEIDCDNDNFIHVSSYMYDKVMLLLELAFLVECA